MTRTRVLLILLMGIAVSPPWPAVNGQTAPLPECNAVNTTATLAAEHQKLETLIDQCKLRQQSKRAIIDKLATEMSTMQETLSRPGIEAYIAPLLSARRRELPDRVSIKRESSLICDEANTTHIRYLTLAEQLAKSKASNDVAMAGQLKKVCDDYREYGRQLVALSGLQDRLLSQTKAFFQMIDERILWLPSAKPIYESQFPAQLMPSAETREILYRAIRSDIQSHWPWYIGAVLLLVLWRIAHGAVTAKEFQIGESILNSQAITFQPTIDALAIGIYHSVAMPALLFFCSIRLAVCLPTSDDTAYQLVLALSVALRRAALFLFAGLFFKRLCRKNGVAESHFQWNANLVHRLRVNLGWLIWVGVPAVLVMNFADSHPDPAWKETIGRIAGITIMIALSVSAMQVWGIRYRSLEDITPAGQPTFWLAAWQLIAAIVPLVLAAGVMTTYSHTAIELGRHIYRTLVLASVLLMVRVIIARFILVSRQKLLDKDGGTKSEDPILSPEKISYRTESLLRWLVVFGMLGGVWLIWRDVVPALRLLGQTELWSFGDNGNATSVHLQDLVLGIVIAIITTALATHGPDLIEVLLLGRLSMDRAARFAVVSIVRYLVILIGVVVALSTVGLGWSRVHWLAAAITVGLGFGLQEVFANFVSGLIILFERPVRIGDIVTVDGVDGKVTRIQMRATTVIDWNRRELIVPNKEFITGRIINWTLSDSVNRVDIPIGIAYGSDIQLARDLLLNVAAQCPHVLPDPPPIAILKGFGESALDFELRVHLANRDLWPDMIHELHTRIDAVFRKAGIEIAFARMDVSVRFPSGTPAMVFEPVANTNETLSSATSESVRATSAAVTSNITQPPEK